LSQVQAIIDAETIRLGGAWSKPEISALLAVRLFASLNNALYRQQALEWVVETVERIDLDFGLYGAGWEEHPRFARFARGPIQYGRALEDLTRRTRINLQIVPYSCLHQRLLDGVAAGGFFLVREHPVDRLTLQFDAIMRSAAEAPDAESVNELRSILNGEQLGQLEEWLTKRNTLVDHRGTDPVANYRAAHRESREYLYDVLPRFDEVTFRAKQELMDRISAFVQNDEERDRIMEEQRGFVKQHYTYLGGVAQLVRVIADRLRDETALSDGEADA
jgi:hypothetical protein